MTQPPQFPSESGAYPEASQATTILVLGILAVVLCQILGPFAWSMGNKELAAIDGGRRPPENRGTANAGRILGIIGTVLLGVGILFAVLAIVGAFTFSVFETT
ncbi:MAG TPA: DUF4190 domain-containing protein [Acidimicrobiia bacterium]|nr:DUF4190 domain-containing protein [Acidimicrobiia bacterium]